MTNAVLLTSAYLAPVQYYTKIYAADCVVEERHDHYVKQTYRNRCVIAGPGGPLPLTVPVENRPSPHTPTCDVRISDHGNWRHLHWQASPVRTKTVPISNTMPTISVISMSGGSTSSSTSTMACGALCAHCWRWTRQS